MKESTFNEEEKKECPFGICDGSGLILEKNFEDFSEVLKKCKCYDIEVMNRKLKKMHIPENFKDLTIKSFDTSIYRKESQPLAIKAKKYAIDFIQHFEYYEGLNKAPYFYSYNKGSGKTRLMFSIGNALYYKLGKTIAFSTTLDLINKVRECYGNNDLSVAGFLENLRKPEILLLDDIGVESEDRIAKDVNSILYSLIDGRKNEKKLTIFTSNSKVEDLKIDERIKDRILEVSYPVKFPEDKIRINISEKINDEIFKRIED